MLPKINLRLQCMLQLQSSIIIVKFLHINLCVVYKIVMLIYSNEFFFCNPFYKLHLFPIILVFEFCLTCQIDVIIVFYTPSYLKIQFMHTYIILYKVRLNQWRDKVVYMCFLQKGGDF